MTTPPMTPPRRRSADLIVSAGILLSRIAGRLLRESLLGHYLGTSDAAGAFKAAIKIPNLLQNLFGEGVLSASFIPVYARLRAEGRDADAARVASAVGSLLFVTVATLSAIGVTAAPWMVALIAAGLPAPVQLLVVKLVQIMFPGVGLLVLSAWCLGVLNSHRKFFLSYAAPVVWNAVQIVVLIAGGRMLGVVGGHGARDTEQARLVVWLAWGTVGGALLQLGVQLPSALRLLGGYSATFGRGVAEVRTVLYNFGPALIGRGAAQFSAYVDLFLVGFLGAAATAAMAYAQQLYLLPISLFGMAVSASELPEMSSAVGGEAEVKAQLHARLTAAFPRLAFFVVPSLIAFFSLGDVVVATLFQSGVFHKSDTVLVWMILCGSTVGLLAATQGRLLSSAFYALHDTQTPLKFALVRLVLTGGMGYAVVLPLRQLRSAGRRDGRPRV